MTKNYPFLTFRLRMVGCAALQMAYVASGKYDVYVTEHLKPWDLAAGIIIVQEAGGHLISPNGGPYDLLSGAIVASGTQELTNEAATLYSEAIANGLQLD